MTECGDFSVTTTWVIGVVCFLFGCFVTFVKMARE